MIRIQISSDRGEGATSTAMFIARLLGSMGWKVLYRSPAGPVAQEAIREQIESSKPLVTDVRSVLIDDAGEHQGDTP